jgi:mannose-6-phosphate isomerase-like protein (cupin superfamily)
VEARDLRDAIRFDPEIVTRETLFETDRLWAEVTCLDRNQTLGPISDDESDAVFTVVAGEAVFVVDRKRQRLKQWRTVLVPARAEVTVTNASTEPLVLMVVAAPPPATRAETE